MIIFIKTLTLRYIKYTPTQTIIMKLKITLIIHFTFFSDCLCDSTLSQAAYHHHQKQSEPKILFYFSYILVTLNRLLDIENC